MVWRTISKLFLSLLASVRPSDLTVRMSVHPRPICAETWRHWKSPPTTHDSPPQPAIPVRTRRKTNKMAQPEERKSAQPLAGGTESSSSLVQRSVLNWKPCPLVWVIHRTTTDRLLSKIETNSSFVSSCLEVVVFFFFFINSRQKCLQTFISSVLTPCLSSQFYMQLSTNAETFNRANP